MERKVTCMWPLVWPPSKTKLNHTKVKLTYFRGNFITIQQHSVGQSAVHWLGVPALGIKLRPKYQLAFLW